MNLAEAAIAEHRGDGAARRLSLVPKASSWLTCSSESPWGVHGAMIDRRCRRCGWTAG